jgi:hypothetical protein
MLSIWDKPNSIAGRKRVQIDQRFHPFKSILSLPFWLREALAEGVTYQT